MAEALDMRDRAPAASQPSPEHARVILTSGIPACLDRTRHVDRPARNVKSTGAPAVLIAKRDPNIRGTGHARPSQLSYREFDSGVSEAHHTCSTGQYDVC
jgi:hypothetical protein